jgi:hypothetical protein
MDAPTGTFIMYSAGAGETALDRLPKDDPDKVNSIYTRKLLPLMKKPGLALHELARQLRREVHDLAVAAPHVQQPAYYDGLIGEFCLAGCESASAPKSASSSPVVPLQRPTVPTYFKCAMSGGVMDGHVYSFSIDTIGRKAAWAEYGVPLDIVHLDDLRIHTSAKLTLSGWPEHDHIGFNFNRLTLATATSASALPERSIEAPSGARAVQLAWPPWLRPSPASALRLW